MKTGGPGEEEQRGDKEVPRVVVVLVRHGETTWNVERKLQGNVEPGPGLTDRGMHQSRCVGRTYDTCDCVYTSPLRRCMETVDCILNEWQEGRVVPVREDGGLKERDLGEFTGCTLHRTGNRDIMQLIKKSNGSQGVETYEELMRRSKRVMHGIVKDAWSHGYEKVMIVSHGGFLGSIARFVDPNTKYSRVSNGSVSRLVAHGHDPVRWTISMWNNVSHMQPCDKTSFGGGSVG